MVDRSIFIVRHGERIDHTDPSWTETAPRPWDPPLTGEGVIQATKTGLSIRNHGGSTVIYTSPFLRCLQTAAAMAGPLGNPPIRIPRYAVQILRPASPRSYSETPTYIPPQEILEMLPSHDPTHLPVRPARYPEEYETMVRRYESTAKQLVKNHPAHNIVFVTHGYGMSHLLRALVPTEYLTNSAYCAITHLRETTRGVFTLERTADPTHWRAKKGQKHTKYYIHGLG